MLTKVPLALLEMTVRVVSFSTTFVSFCLRTAVPVLGTVSRFLAVVGMHFPRAAWPGVLQQAAVLQKGMCACKDVHGPCDQEHI